MGNISLIIYKKGTNFIVMAEGEEEKLTDMIEVIKERFPTAKLVQVGSEEYQEAKMNAQSLNNLIQSKY